MGLREDPARQSLAFAYQSEQEMLGLDGITAQLCCFIASKENYSLRALGVSLEHVLHPK
jgi:hypothetical protein